MADKGKKPMTRSKTATDEKKRRSQRNVSPKNADDAVSGMSRQEEQDLNRAIHLSLQEARRQSRTDRTRVDMPDPSNETSQSLSSPQPSTSTQHMDESCCSMDSAQSSSGAGICLGMSCTSTASTSTESSKSSSPEPKKIKYHAQRKFAANAFIPDQPEPSSLQMPSNWRSLSLDTQLKYLAFAPSTPLESHDRPRYQSLPNSCFPFYPDVDDLLTWICFKDLMPLPRHLDLLNLSKEEYEAYHPKSDRDSGLADSPPAASSGSLNHQAEDSRDMSDMNQQKQQTPKKKAARASASTPQTARGLANLRSSTKTSQTTEIKPSPEKRKRKTESSPFKSSRKHPVSEKSASSAEGTFKSPRKHSVSDRSASSVEGSFKSSHKSPVSDRLASSAEGTFKSPHKGPVSDRSALKRKAVSMHVCSTRSTEKQKRKLRSPIPDSDPPVKKDETQNISDNKHEENISGALQSTNLPSCTSSQLTGMLIHASRQRSRQNIFEVFSSSLCPTTGSVVSDKSEGDTDRASCSDVGVDREHDSSNESQIHISSDSTFENLGSKFVESLASNVLENLNANFVKSWISNVVKGFTSNVVENLASNVVEGLTSNVVENLASNVVESLASNVVEGLTSDVVENLASNVVEGLTSNVVENLASNVVENFASNVVEGLALNVVENLASNVVENLASNVVEGLTSNVVENLASNVVEGLTSNVVESLASNVVESLASNVFEGLTSDVVENLASNVVEGLTSNVVENLASNVVENLASNVVEGLTSNVVENLASNVVEGLTLNVVENLASDVVENLASNVVENLASNVVENLASNVVENLASNVVEGLTSNVVENLASNVVENFASNVVEGLALNVVENLASNVVENLASNVVEGLTSNVVESLASNVVESLASNVVEGLTSDVVENLASNVVEGLTSNVVENLASNVVENLASNVVEGLTSNVVENLASNVVEGLTLNVVENLASDVVENLASNVVENLASNVVENLASNVVENLASNVVENLASNVIEGLSANVQGLHISVDASSVDLEGHFTDVEGHVKNLEGRVADLEGHGNLEGLIADTLQQKSVSVMDTVRQTMDQVKDVLLSQQDDNDFMSLLGENLIELSDLDNSLEIAVQSAVSSNEPFDIGIEEMFSVLQHMPYPELAEDVLQGGHSNTECPDQPGYHSSAQPSGHVQPSGQSHPESHDSSVACHSSVQPSGQPHPLGPDQLASTTHDKKYAANPEHHSAGVIISTFVPVTSEITPTGTNITTLLEESVKTEENPTCETMAKDKTSKNMETDKDSESECGVSYFRAKNPAKCKIISLKSPKMFELLSSTQFQDPSNSRSDQWSSDSEHSEPEAPLIKKSGCSSRLRSKSAHFRKHKSENEQEDTSSISIISPLKQLKLESSTRSNVKVTTRAMDVVSKSKSKYDDVLETHPSKHLSTRMMGSSTRPKRKFKPHRPMTRAATHMKSILKAAKIAANKKLRMMSHTLPKANDYTKLSRIVEAKRHNVGLERKRSSWTSTSSKLSCSSGDSSSEIHMKTELSPSEKGRGSVTQCPIYYPTVEQFRDPILYIQSIQSEAEQYGMCKIVPPGDWKMESHEMEDSHFRFTSQIQYIHKMMHKWSPITEQLECIKRLYNDAGNKELVVPQIGGIEIDLVKLYDLAKKYGGMKETAGKEKKWMKIAEAMKIPKRVSKLYAAYCKYLVAYETLSDEERSKLTEMVQEERKLLENGNECIGSACYQCVFKGPSQMLSRYHKIAQNTQQFYCQDENMHVEDIESHYWDIVNQSNKHVSVQGANLDTSVYGSLFPVGKDAQYARHSWNLHNFVKGKGSVLQHLGLIAGVTVPTLHIGMLYSSTCLACNGHNLPTVQYLHQGPGLIWYAVPSHEVNNLKSALKYIVPTHVRDEGFCLEQDSVMVPPAKLLKKGVCMSRCVQSPREFIVVFPSVYYSNVSLGYNLSESVHYGTQDWIPEGYKASLYLGMNHGVELFSMDALLVFLAQDPSTPDTTLARLLPYLEKVVDREITERKQLHDSGLKTIERLEPTATKTTQKLDILEEIIICDMSKKLCYLSVVLNPHENSAFSLQQGLVHIQKRKNLKNYKLMYRFSEDELRSLIREVKNKLKDSNSSSPAISSPKRKTRKSVLHAKCSPVASSATQ